MPRKSFKLRTPVSAKSNGADVAEALLKILAVGVAGGVALLKGSQTVGETLESAIEGAQTKLEERRAADREEVRRISESEDFDDIETGDE